MFNVHVFRFTQENHSNSSAHCLGVPFAIYTSFKLDEIGAHVLQRSKATQIQADNIKHDLLSSSYFQKEGFHLFLIEIGNRVNIKTFNFRLLP